MKNIFKFIALLFPVIFSAQFNFFSYTYADCLEESFQEQLGINLSISKEGSYKKAKDLLKSDYYQKHTKESFFIQTLLDYNTLGKEKAYRKISESKLSGEDQDFLKVWLALYTQNPADYEILYSGFRKKYPYNMEAMKLYFRSKMIDANRLSGVSYTEKQKALVSIDSLMSTKLSSDAQLYFSLLKLDFKDFDRASIKNSQIKFSEFRKLWNSSRDKMNYIGVGRIIGHCEADCDSVSVWISEKREEDRPFTSTEKVYVLLNRQMKKDTEKLSVFELQKKISEIYEKENNEEQKDHLRGLVTAFSMDKVPDLGFLMEGAVRKINFSPEFLKKFTLQCKSREACFEKLKVLIKQTDYSVLGNSEEVQSQVLSEVQKELGKYPLEIVKQGYGLLVYTNTMNKLLLLFMEDGLGKYKENTPTEIYSSTSSLLEYIAENPLYYEEVNYGSENGYKEINSKEKLREFNTKMEKIISDFPGALGIRLKYIFLKNQFSELVPQNERQNFYFDYLKNIVDFFCLNQRLDFVDFENLFFSSFMEKREDLLMPFKEFYTKLDISTQKKINDYLNLKIKEFPRSENLKRISEKLGKE
ncbi:hypothetical protein EG359_08180 [Chryseobacterium joostei]|uniref:Uncharacterized protein n=1 Tax=Chryseobacterium joostei TaxID=112234 RepID=A0A1N7JGU2_9FLAO|nr:hypothetical protein [Chryseobacterium joostei]AZA99590.1 hypothetical protein EG359_08180 [Chryseobacterium joostei]SIS31210.1 hypothetical protein SAMN05421768_102283 [Chryseobacterium joostei]SIS48446.1 hypothetical protein SAMN05421768_108282 [Chryseobacterium joostei]